MRKLHYKRHTEDQRRLKRRLIRATGSLRDCEFRYDSIPAYKDEKTGVYKPIYKDNYYKYLKRYANRKTRYSADGVCSGKGRKFRKIFDVPWNYY